MRTRDLVGFGPRVVFRHSLVCSVVCHGTQQRRIHRALADAGDAGQHPDRVAWHWGWLRAGLMTRWRHGWSRRLGARERGGYAATATFVSRAAELTVDGRLRATRLLAAADAELTSAQSIGPVRCWIGPERVRHPGPAAAVLPVPPARPAPATPRPRPSPT